MTKNEQQINANHMRNWVALANDHGFKCLMVLGFNDESGEIGLFSLGDKDQNEKLFKHLHDDYFSDGIHEPEHRSFVPPPNS